MAVLIPQKMAVATTVILASNFVAISQASGVCDCQNWADVYYRNLASCGRANELYFLSKWGFSAAYAATEPITGLPHKVCADFFRNFLSTACVNVDLLEGSKPTNSSGLQWCYVSNDCDNLNGGEYATNQIGFAQGAWSNQQSASTLAWKICEPAADAMLKHMSVQEVIDAATESDVSLSRILRLAYPAVNITYGQAAAFLEAVNDAYNATLTLEEMVDSVDTPAAVWGSTVASVHARLAAIVKSEQATVLDSLGHGDNFHVVQGRAVYEVKRTENGNMAYLGGHFADEFAVSCVLGCALPERLDAVDLETL
ncbi:unnamed protein product [Prorocentrum cordatum]|uniref:Uncharacterized protein n=1 Tax=Prorocentrum cordatum TaxID=2364126 RepID=A0ABN9VW32_9DINO|nr:unnamed protein product [Polarella glacialis]